MYISSKLSTNFTPNFYSIKKRVTRISDKYVFLLGQKGSIKITTSSGDSVLSLDGVFLLQPDAKYTFSEISDNQIFALACEKDFIDALIPANYSLSINSNSTVYIAKLTEVLKNIALNCGNDEPSNTFIAYIYMLMDVLSEYAVPASDNDSNNYNKTEDRIRAIDLFLKEHYHLPIYLQTLADEMHLSPQYLSKFIKQSMGVTFTKHLNNIRLEHACEELLHTDHSVIEIALNNGFSGSSTFNKIFHDKYNCSPSVFRKEHLNDAPSEPHISQNLIKGEFHPSEEDENLVISYSESEEIYPSWRDTINIGTLSSALTTDFRRAFVNTQERIGFKYVKFYNFFSPSVIKYLPESDDFDFSNLDMVFDLFKEFKIIPFVELCYKEPKVSITKDIFDNDSEFSDEPDQEYILKVLEATLKHCINRYGYSAVSKWRFEVWAKHDSVLNYTESPTAYIKKFCAFNDLIKSILPDCEVGGPGFNTSAGDTTLLRLLNEMKQQNVFPDFFAIYIYTYEPANYTPVSSFKGDNLKILSADPDYSLKTFDRVENIIRMFSQDIPIYITEFNSSLNGLNHVAASAYQAAFIFKNMTDLFTRTKCIAYWNFSDVSEVSTTDPQTYATGMGLLDRHGIPKPSFFAYLLMSLMESRVAAHGHQYVATTNNRNKYQFMTANYMHYNTSYCFTHMDRIALGDTYKIFEHPLPKQMQVTMTDLPLGRYKCKRYIINRNFGSVLDKYIHILNYGKISPDELNHMLMNLDYSEVDYFMKVTCPREEISYIDNVTGSVTLDIEMEPHEVILISLDRRI